MNTVPVAEDSPDAQNPCCIRRRTAVYCIVLAMLASVLMFWELGADALTGDEAQYALIVQNIRKSGDWVYVSPYPPAPYFQKPPLYFWLSAATYDLFGPTELTYRLWSAAAGVGAVVLTCVLGAMLFSPEIGALAGLLIMTNRAFLLVHGARSGTFDAVVTFLILAGIVLYVMMLRRRLRWAGWIGIGLLAGLVSLAKPFVGVPLVVLLALHAIFNDRQSSRALRMLGPLLALLVLCAVAMPWYAAQWNRYPDFANELLQKNLYDRAVEGVDDKHVEDWKFYAEQITKSSIPFLLAIPAAIFSAYEAFKSRRRLEHSLLLYTGVGWVLLFSLSASKAVHYIYPAMPAFAVMLAAGGFALVQGLLLKWSSRQRTAGTIAIGVIVLAAFSFHYARTLYHSIPADRSPYVPWELYKLMSPAIARGEAQVIFYGFPDEQIDWRSQLQLRARDCYYLEQMSRGARWTREWGELANELHPQKPSLVLLARGTNMEEMLPQTNLAQRTDSRFVYHHQAYLALGVDLQRLLSPRLSEHNPYIRLDSADLQAGTLRLTLAAPIPAPARLTVRLKLAPGAGSAVRYTFAFDQGGGDWKKLDDRFTRVSADSWIEASTTINSELWRNVTNHSVTLTLRPPFPTESPPAILSIQDAHLIMRPTIPSELHPQR